VAIDLAAAGIHVDLFDRNGSCMTQASLKNEGKIHLGYVYAKDSSLRSAETMVAGAAVFAPLLEEWLETPISHLGRSMPFNYAVHRSGMLSAEEFESHLNRTHAVVVETIGRHDYFGVDIRRPPERLPPSLLEDDYDPAVVEAVYRTNEISIDPAALAAAVHSRVSSDPLISSVFDSEVHGARVEGRRVAVDFTSGGARTSIEYDQVVNALWDGRLAVDATVGLVPNQPWLFRVKHYLMVRSPKARLPSTTVVLGPFGDIVDYGNGSFYLSWYPSGLQGVSSETVLPQSLRSLPDDAARAVRSGIVEGLASVVPRVADLPAAEIAAAGLAGGVIFAWGATDIDDRASGLHNRFSIGPHTFGAYHTVDTGKLTTAPLYARMVGERVRARQ
jgi:hypothetical protein